MIIKKAEFVTSAVSIKGCPPNDRPEVVFAGRSNVGKSSLINSMLNRKNLVKTSSQPGKTRLINFFNINDFMYFVDLPGYGYASVPKSEKAKWGNIIEEYLLKRQNLMNIILLVDIRHEPTSDDILMYNWIKNYNRNVIVMAVKSDKIPKGKIQKNLEVIRKSLNLDKGDILLPFSSQTKSGREELWGILDEQLGINEPFRV
jgi:GTP-binding protein